MRTCGVGHFRKESGDEVVLWVPQLRWLSLGPSWYRPAGRERRQRLEQHVPDGPGCVSCPVLSPGCHALLGARKLLSGMVEVGSPTSELHARPGTRADVLASIGLGYSKLSK